MTQNGFSLVVSYKEKVKDSRKFHPEHIDFNYYVFVICMPIMYLEPEKEGTMGYLLHKSPKFYYNVFLFIGLNTLGTLNEFDWLVYQIEFQPLIVIYRRGNFVY